MDIAAKRIACGAARMSAAKARLDETFENARMYSAAENGRCVFSSSLRRNEEVWHTIRRHENYRRARKHHA